MEQQTLFTPADILLPKGVDLEKWSVVACDQFTSQPDYWEEAARRVGDAPSALHLIFPEVYLEDGDTGTRIDAINGAMEQNLAQGIFQELNDVFIYVERTLPTGAVRRGLVGKLDLEAYDFSPDSQSPVRPTEGTVESRLPPRIRVRENAPLELPHIMVLIDDPKRSVIEPLQAEKAALTPVYSFQLGENGGKISGWSIQGEKTAQLTGALSALFASESARGGKAPVHIAVGDGNHSLATAKSCYEALKKKLPEEEWRSHPARWALVELVNVHDEGLEFEPIHRVLFDTDPEALLTDLKKAYPCADGKLPEGQAFEWVYGGKRGWLTITEPPCQIAVGSLQRFLDGWLEAHAGRIDYIHGDDAVLALAAKPGAIGFLLPSMDKGELFPTVQLDGALPRKTFSMGSAEEKRYYLEARKITR